MAMILNEACSIVYGAIEACIVKLGNCKVWPNQEGTCGIGLMTIGVDFTIDCGGGQENYLIVNPESEVVRQDASPTNIEILCNNTWSCHK